MPKHEYGTEGAYVWSQVFWRALAWFMIALFIGLLALFTLGSLKSPWVCVGGMLILPPILITAVKELAKGAKQSISPYAKGLSGELAVARHLRDAIGDEGYLVHDLKIGDRGNIDHVAVTPGGVYSIETKAWEGSVLVRGDRLWVNRQEHEHMLRQAFAESRVVRDYLDRISNGWKHDVTPVLVFTRAKIESPAMCRGVWVTGLKDLGAGLTHHKGILDHTQRSRIAAALGQMTSTRVERR